MTSTQRQPILAWLMAWLMPAERYILAASAVMGTAAVLLALVRGYRVDWISYGMLGAECGALIVAGLAFRIKRRPEEFSVTLLATGCFLSVVFALPILNYCMLPLWHAPIDPQLAALDAVIGFHWPDVMALAAKLPFLVELTRYPYLSTEYELALIILLLGLSGRTRHLQTIMLAMTLAAVTTVCFWTAFPSLSTLSIYTLPPDVLQAVKPVLGADYGAEMLKIAAKGPRYITPNNTTGLVSMPSFHTVMALMIILATCKVPYLRWPFMAFNLLILPGAIIHGGHHLVDIFAGIGVAAGSFALATHLLAGREQAVSGRLNPVAA